VCSGRDEESDNQEENCLNKKSEPLVKYGPDASLGTGKIHENFILGSE
jgi:hypothetical protein